LTTVRFSALATRQVDKIFDYISRDNPAAAATVVTRIYQVASHAASFPEAGRLTVIGGVRMFVVSPYPYVIFARFLARSDEVRIVAVRHTARRRPALHEDTAEFRR
jgi:toxin ParE1/3/4